MKITNIIFNYTALISMVLPFISAKHLRNAPRRLQETVDLDPSNLLYSQIPDVLEPWEEIATEIVNNTVDERSQTFQGSVSQFKVLRPRTKGAHITKLTFVTEIDNVLLARVDAEFSDGSRDTGGFPNFRGGVKNAKVHQVKLPGKLQGTIIVEARKNADTRVNRVHLGKNGPTIARGQSDLRGHDNIYDVDGRYLTGLIVPAAPVMTNLQFIVSKEIIDSTLSNIEYSLPQLGDGADPKSLETITLSNDSSETQNFAVSYTSIEESAISFSSERTRSLSVGFGISTSFDFKIPFVGSVGVGAEFTSDVESTFSSGRTEEQVETKQVTKSVSVSVPPRTKTTLTVLQYQEQIANVPYKAIHTVTFSDGTIHQSEGVEGTMEGVAVSSVFMTTKEVPIAV